MHDVIIVGCGPAGSTVATTIKELSDKDVLVLERRGEVGIPRKPCGGGLSHYWINQAGINVPKEIIRSEIKTFTILSRNHEVSFTAKDIGIKIIGYVIDRAKFDQHLASEAVKSGVEMRPNKKLIDFDNKKSFIEVYTDEEKFRTKYLVGADGANSAVRKGLNLPKPSKENIHIAVQETRTVEDYDQSEIQIYLNSRYAPQGYLWLFPSGSGKVRIGNGVPLSIAMPRRYLKNFFEDHPEYNGEVTYRTGGLIPLTLSSTCVRGNVALVGDAACQVDSLTGGGIGPSIICARELGRALANDSIDSYEPAWRRKLWDLFYRRYKIKQVLCKWSDSDFDRLIDAVKDFEIKSSNFPKEMSRALFHISRKHPLLIPRTLLRLL